MIGRFSLGILFAVLVAASRPATEGGAHDLLVVGVRAGNRLVLGSPEGKARDAYERLLRSPARDDLLKGRTVHAPTQGDPRIVEIVFYGHRSRAGRSAVDFTAPAESLLPGAAEAFEAARELASMPGPVTAASARILLGSEDLGAYRDALEALSAVQADAASAEATKTALAATAPVERRIVAIRVLKGLGGKRCFPEVFRALETDTTDAGREAAK